MFLFPARPEWQSSVRIKLRNIVLVTVLVFVSGAVSTAFTTCPSQRH